jgi:excisionase family DNA binding protein
MNQPLINTQQAARLLGVHPHTIRRWAEIGQIPAIKAGRVWRFDPTALQGWAGISPSEAGAEATAATPGEPPAVAVEEELFMEWLTLQIAQLKKGHDENEQIKLMAAEIKRLRQALEGMISAADKYTELVAPALQKEADRNTWQFYKNFIDRMRPQLSPVASDEQDRV